MRTTVIHVRDFNRLRLSAGENYVYIGRGSKWGNPYRIGPDGDRAEVIRKYAEMLHDRRPDLADAARTELKGKYLGCYCAPLPCHGDVLVAIAEGEEW